MSTHKLNRTNSIQEKHHVQQNTPHQTNKLIKSNRLNKTYRHNKQQNPDHSKSFLAVNMLNKTPPIQPVQQNTSHTVCLAKHPHPPCSAQHLSYSLVLIIVHPKGFRNLEFPFRRRDQHKICYRHIIAVATTSCARPVCIDKQLVIPTYLGT